MIRTKNKCNERSYSRYRYPLIDYYVFMNVNYDRKGIRTIPETYADTMEV